MSGSAGTRVSQTYSRRVAERNTLVPLYFTGIFNSLNGRGILLDYYAVINVGCFGPHSRQHASDYVS